MLLPRPSAVRALSLALLLSAPAAARACTVCNSAAGRNLRAGIFDGHFLRTLAAVASPFPFFALAVAVPSILGRLAGPELQPIENKEEN